MFKPLLALFALLAGMAAASAEPIDLRRGLNLDAWETWPAEDAWGDPAVLLPFPEWRKRMTPDRLVAIKAAGFDFLRVPVDPAPFLSPRSATLRPQLVDSLRQSVRLIQAAGLKVVVDLHLMPAGPGDAIGTEWVMQAPGGFDAYIALVGEIAGALRGENPDAVALELMNEPILDCEPGSARWPERLERLYSAAREQAPDLVLVLGGGCYSSVESLAALDLSPYRGDDRIVWTFHSYAPFLLTHQGATWAGDVVRYVEGLPFPLDRVPRAELDRRLDAVRRRIEVEAPVLRRAGILAYVDEEIAKIDTEAKARAAIDAPLDAAAAWARANGVPPGRVLLGEFGMIRRESGSPNATEPADRAAYVRMAASAVESRGFAWSLWSYGGAFGVVEGFDGEPAEPDVLEAVRTLDLRN